MTFYLDGQEWDTNKPVYVIGYTLMRTWFPFESRKSSEYRNSLVEEDGKLVYRLSENTYPITCKKLYIHFIEMSPMLSSGTTSMVRSFKTTMPPGCPWSPFDYKNEIIANSPIKAKERLLSYAKQQNQISGRMLCRAGNVHYWNLPIHERSKKRCSQ